MMLLVMQHCAARAQEQDAMPANKFVLKGSGVEVDYTIGVFETFSGPDSVPRRPSTWRCIEMTGMAQSVIVPLEAPAGV